MNRAYNIIRSELTSLYGAGEAAAIARLVMEVKYGASMTDVLTKPLPPTSTDAELSAIVQRLKGGEPVQYVLGEAFFCGHRIEVGPGVLIPRPETEWLARHPLSSLALRSAAMADGEGLRILDMCTGSGCIALALKKMYPAACVEAADVSPEALAIAQRNFRAHGLGVITRQVDLLDPEFMASVWPSSEVDGYNRTGDSGGKEPLLLRERSEGISLIVSNPPYVLDRERTDIEPHVLEHEPALALFVPDDDPLRFYRPLARLGRALLCEGGELRVECNTAYADAVAQLFEREGFAGVQVHEDCFGMPRFVNCTLQNQG